MYDDFRKAIEDLAKLGEHDRQYAITWLVVWAVLAVLRYAATGIVVFLLGRRIINAFAYSMKPIRDQEQHS